MYVYLKGAVEDEFRREWNIGMDVTALEACILR